MPDFKSWHNRLGHISSDRYQLPSKIIADVQFFPRSVIETFQCDPCIITKLKKSPIKASVLHDTGTTIYVDISVPTSPRSLGDNVYRVPLLETSCRTSERFTVPLESSSFDTLKFFTMKVHNCFRAEKNLTHTIRADNAKDNLSKDLVDFYQSLGVTIKISSAYALDSHGIAERLVQEHWARACVLLFSSELPNTLWG